MLSALLAVILLGVGDRPALVDAARNADAAALRAILSGGASVNAPESDGTTALHWASYRDAGDSGQHDNGESYDQLVQHCLTTTVPAFLQWRSFQHWDLPDL